MSGDLIQLWDKGVLLQGIWETIYLTFISSFVAYVFGLPIGVLLTVTDKDGIHPIPWLNKIIGILVNIFRSIPFIILMVACLPAAKVIVGTSLGNTTVQLLQSSDLTNKISPEVSDIQSGSLANSEGALLL